MEINYVCSLGPYCQSSQVLKRWNLKKCSYPFDWIFSNCDIILHCIKDDFKVFLDREYYKTITHDRCEHTYYKLGCMFNHSNPKIDDDKYSYYGRCVNRFRSLLAYDGHKLFMMMMLNMVEPDEKNITQITEFNNELIKSTQNYTLLVILHFPNKEKNYHSFDYKDNIHFLELHTYATSNGVVFTNEIDNIYLDTIIHNKYKFNIRS